MTAPRPARIFISYATKDGAGFAAKLRRDLEALGFSIWQDIVALHGNADWWSQIEAALRSKELQHFILIVTPGAMASSIVRQEIRLAKQEAKTISPVRGPGINDIATLPRWLGNVYDLDVAERHTNLMRVLGLPSSARRVPLMAPEPPADFVARPTEFDSLKKRLLDPKGDAVAITAALRGAGGYGKTTLAKKLAHDAEIQDAYFDGVLWVELGEQGGGKVLSLISDLTALVTGEARTMTTIEAARTALAEALGDRRILLVIDDVWRKHDLEPFLQGGSHTTRLVTTRFDRELPEAAFRHPVDAMRPGEALKLLAWGLPEEQAQQYFQELTNLAQQLHDWAQLLKLANGFLRDRVGRFKLPLHRAIAEAGQRLAAKGLPAFDDAKVMTYEGRHRSVAAAIGINLDLLEVDQRARFGELGIFPEDADIPVGIVARLWAETGGVDEFATVDMLTGFYDLSLLLELDLDRRTFRFHDTTRHFLQHQAGKSGLVTQHKKLIQAMGDMGGAAAAPASETDYFYRYLPSHLADADDRDTLDALLLDPGWLQAKLDATNSPQALVADYVRFGTCPMHALIGQTLKLTSGICARDKRQLLPQLIGRLTNFAAPIAPDFLAAARRSINPPALLTKHPSLTPPGAEIARLEGHADGVWALAVLPDGRLASGSKDKSVRLWDLKTGQETARLEGHSAPVSALAVLTDGLLASGAYDGTIRLWDVSAQAESSRLQGHTSLVSALTVLSNGLLASGSDDKSIRLWDPRTGKEKAKLDGHSSLVRCLLALPEGRLASGADDGSIRLWDTNIGLEIGRLQGQLGLVMALALLPDGRLASAHNDMSIRLWDMDTGRESANYRAHTSPLRALAVLPNGRLASASDDKTICLWDTKTGTEIARFDGHSAEVYTLAILPHGRLASGSYDKSIKLWDPELATVAPPLDGHSDQVNALTVLRDGCLASASNDKTIRVWDPRTGNQLARLEGNTRPVLTLAELADGRLASGSLDGTICLWDPKTASEVSRLTTGSLGDAARHISAIAALPDGRLAFSSSTLTKLWNPESSDGIDKFIRLGSPVLALLTDGRLALAAHDHAIRLWDLSADKETARLEGHSCKVSALAVLDDGRLVSGSDDTSIRLWNHTNSAEAARLIGHEARINALVGLPHGRIASGSDDRTVRVWDVCSNKEICRMELDSVVLCLAALPDGRFVAGDQIGKLHWFDIVD
ncbi:MAG: NB-ARC domain-containing protein [Candidatus Competibacter sp.]|nr:NB-ARC domain-containing protein [Candidatus Competibacter sp.]